jgi:tetratricopeptide (TPR) repeat protein
MLGRDGHPLSHWFGFAVIGVFLLGLGGCGSPEQRAQYHYERGVELAKEGELAKAALEFRNALSLDEDMVPALFASADIEQRNHRLDRAVTLLERVVELSPSHIEARIQLGSILLAAGELERASKVIDEAMRLAPTRPDVLVTKATLALKEGHPGEAVELANTALEADPKIAEAVMVLASVRLDAGDVRGAIAIIDEHLKSSPDSLSLNLMRIRALEVAGDRDGVEQALMKLVDRYPDNKGLRLALVGGHIAANKIDAAESEFRRVIELAPKDVNLKLAFVDFLIKNKGEEAARAELVKYAAAGGPDSIRYSLALARLEIAAGGATDGEAELRKILAGENAGTADGLAAKAELARLLLQTDRRPEGERLIEEVLAADQHQVEALTLRGWMRFRDGDLDDAIIDLRTGLSEAPNSIPINLILAEVYERRGQVDLAEEHLAFVAEESGYDPETSRAYIRFLQRHRDFDRAEQVLTDVLSRHPKNTEIAAALAAVKLRKRDWAGAEELTKITREGDDPGQISDRIAAAALLGEGRTDEGLSLLKKLHADNPDAPGPLASIVQAYLGAGRSGDAEALLNSVVAEKPDSTYGNVLLALLELSQGRTEDAVASATTALQANPNEVEAVRVLAVAYLRRGESRKALNVVDEAIAKNDGNDSLKVLRAGVLEGMGDIDAAISVYEGMLRKDPSLPIAVNNLASLLSQYRTDSQSLERAFELTKALNPYASPHFQDTIGWLHYLRTDYGLAKQFLEAAAEGLPDVPAVRYHLGMVYVALGQHDLATENLEKALELAKATDFPQLADARAALSRISSAPDGSKTNEAEPPAPSASQPLRPLESGSGAPTPQGS